MKKILPLFLSLTVMFILHLAAFPAKAIDKDWTFDPKTSSLIPKYLGKVKVLKGMAFIGDRELKNGSKIYNDELVQTKAASYLVIEMIDLTTVTLGPESDFLVENWSYRTKNDRNATFNVSKGKWRALIKSKSKDIDQLKIKTSLISMGVRGTELLVNVETLGDKVVNQVALLSGNIHMEGDLPDGMKKDMIAGDYAVIEKSGKTLEQRSKVMDAKEMKSYQEFVAPRVLRLLDPEATASKDQSKTGHSQVSADQISPSAHLLNKTEAPSKSLKENIEILNTTRENNLKKK